MSDKRFGVICFDDVENPKEGWYAVGDGKPNRMESPNSLASDTIWLTNVPYEHYRKSKLANSAFLRSDGYLIVKIDQILKEW